MLSTYPNGRRAQSLEGTGGTAAGGGLGRKRRQSSEDEEFALRRSETDMSGDEESGSMLDKAMSSVNRNQRWITCWLAMGFLALIWVTSLPHIKNVNAEENALQPEANNVNKVSVEKEKETSTDLANSYAEQLAAVQTRLTTLEETLLETRKASEELVESMNVLKQQMERVGEAAFTDGTTAMMAVVENAIFSPKQWVKLCEWENCQAQSITESFTSLIKSIPSTSGTSIKAVHLTSKCPDSENPFAATLTKQYNKEQVVVGVIGDVPTNSNCSFSLVPAAQILRNTKDKTLDVVVFEGNGMEDAKPILGSLLRDWSPKIKTGGVAAGRDYVVNSPFKMRWNSQKVTAHEIATKGAVDTFRTGDDNELGQNDIVNVAGGSLWYFRKIKPTLFG